jgi:hypothetical protein
MGTGRTLRKKPRTRPAKSPGEKRRRVKVQKARLIKLGMDPAAVEKLQPNRIRTLLLRPARIRKTA